MQSDEKPEYRADDVPPPTDVNVLVAYYASARGEILQRLQQRDQAVVLFVGVVGVVFTAALTSFRQRYALLFALPYLGLGASFVTTQHNAVIDALGQYCRTALASELHRLGSAIQWDESAPYQLMGKVAFGHRLRGQLLLLVGPQITATALGMYGLFRWIGEIRASHALVITTVIITTLVPISYSVLIVIGSERGRRLMSPLTANENPNGPQVPGGCQSVAGCSVVAPDQSS